MQSRQMSWLCSFFGANTSKIDSKCAPYKQCPQTSWGGALFSQILVLGGTKTMTEKYKNGIKNRCHSNDDNSESIWNTFAKNLCFCMFPPSVGGGASNVIIQIASIIWISTILAHYTQINMFIQLDGILAYLESQHQKANNMIAELNISHKIPNLIF